MNRALNSIFVPNQAIGGSSHIPPSFAVVGNATRMNWAVILLYLMQRDYMLCTVTMLLVLVVSSLEFPLGL